MIPTGWRWLPTYELVSLSRNERLGRDEAKVLPSAAETLDHSKVDKDNTESPKPY